MWDVLSKKEVSDFCDVVGLNYLMICCITVIGTVVHC